MSIVKMEAVTIAGPVEEFERIVSKYIYDREIHLENAMSVLSYRERLHTFEDANHYEPVVRNIESILNQAGMQPKEKTGGGEYSLEEINEFLDAINGKIETDRDRLAFLEAEAGKNKEMMTKLETILDVNVDLSKLFDFEFIRFQFGRIPKSGYKTLTTYLGDLDAIFVKTTEDAQNVWGFYFVPEAKAAKVDEVFASLYFEAMDIPEEFHGVPREIKKRFEESNQKLQKEIEAIQAKTREGIKGSYDKLCDIYRVAKKRQMFTQIRRNAVHSDEFFYIVGWMPKKDAAKLEREIKEQKEVVLFVSTEPDKVSEMKPPTKLKNNPIFKPFEFFVKMYGLPDYTEIDPTPLLAITYILFFGIMFGDVGQSALFAIGGFLIYKLKKIDLAGIIGMVGLSGVLFGFIYGSIFGNEKLLTPLVAPMDQINFMLISTIAIGVVIIIGGLILNIINSIRAGDVGRSLCGHNGLAGLVFYVSLITLVLKMVGIVKSVPGWLLTTLLIVTVVIMYLGEPLADLIDGKKDWMPKGGMFFVENLFEMFEVILSFFTNTISFLRVGAFAIVHVGMMMVVGVLSKGNGFGSILVMILGNVLVMGLEGLIVGIQVLRLEYYEMFSHYFSGQGKDFVSIEEIK